MGKTLLLLLMIAAAPLYAQDSPHGPLKIPCSTCHVTDSWTRKAGAGFDHSTTGWALAGSHAATPCVACHKDLTFKKMSTLCQSCHTDVHRKDLGDNCVSCHTPDAWKVVDMVQKHEKMRFPLVGRHSTAECAACHTSADDHKYSGAPVDCIGCHRIDFQNTKNPNHISAGFSTTCDKCHMVSDFQWAGSAKLTATGFDHSTTRFPLTGAHALVDCATCHKDNIFTGLSIDCYSCHQADYAGVVQPNHVSGNFDRNCTTCHNTTAWKPASATSFDHATTPFGFAWTGKHLTAACADCHTNDNYGLKYTDCYACHQADFAKSTNPNHVSGNLDHDCTKCHSFTVFKPSTFDHATATKFALTGVHATTACADCHKNGNYKTLAFTDCYACHQTDFTGVTVPNHVTGSYAHDCSGCHSTAAWKPASVTSYDHTKGPFGFAWTGKHTGAACADCHTNGNYSLQYTDCYACHSAEFAISTNPNHVTGNLSHDCTSCHSFTVFKPSTFDHSAQTKFALTGKHATTMCADCHKNGNYKTLAFTDCYSCHQADYTGVVTPNHVSGNYAHDCTGCHSTTAWKPASVSNFDHKTTPFGFAWQGAHLSATCESCHTNGNYSIAYTDCYTCHTADFAKSTNPNHVTGNLDHDCTKCHSFTVFKPATFDHGTATNFPLTGAHTTTPCADCHTNGNYKTLAFTDCFACHQAEFTGVVTPNHVSGNYSHNCTSCHSTTAWKPASVTSFDHTTTPFGFAWRGKHLSAACEDCHTNANYSIKFTDCYACHQADFAKSTEPNHVTGNLDHDCTKCHSFNVFKPSTFDHSTATKFALTGTHATTPCSSCHTNGNYKTVVFTDCYACHQADFSKSTTVNHVAAGLSHDCTSCHNTTVWKPSTFNHSATAFPLTGKHATVACQDCHTNNNYTTLKYTDCYTCHTGDFTTAANPNHVQGNFSHVCTDCHNTQAWSPATFDHSKTAFALTGKHTTVACQDCHTNGNYTIKYTDCYACHSADFALSTTVPHVAAGLSHDCTSCHTTSVWKPSTFNHSTTAFPLTGKHSTTACQDCHKGNYTTLKFTDCYTCHTGDFTGAANPNHVQGNFSHVCADCHSTTAWSPATFDHSKTAFPLTGKHTTVLCQDCHTNGNYTIKYTDCYACHTADFAKSTTVPHVAGGISHDCTTCHTTSQWLPSTFNHSTTAFALTGKHSTIACQDCHKSNYSTLKYTDCYACHSADFTGATNPNHVQGGFSHDCKGCHNTSAWSPATFDHSTTAFPLTGAHTSTACADCHTNGNYTLKYTDCYACHSADFAKPTNPNHVTSGFSHTCAPCHTTSAWLPATFNHTWFRITTSRHNVPCSQCHQVPTNYTQFNCQFACHRNAHHNGEACYPCHKS